MDKTETAGPDARAAAGNGLIDRFDPAIAQWTILLICLTMIVGGLALFYFRLKGRQQKWRIEYNQVVGTVFFFPTLIILAVYLNMSRDAVVGILGAFLGSLFTRTIGSGTPERGGPGTTEPTKPLTNRNSPNADAAEPDRPARDPFATAAEPARTGAEGEERTVGRRPRGRYGLRGGEWTFPDEEATARGAASGSREDTR